MVCLWVCPSAFSYVLWYPHFRLPWGLSWGLSWGISEGMVGGLFMGIAPMFSYVQAVSRHSWVGAPRCWIGCCHDEGR